MMFFGPSLSPSVEAVCLSLCLGRGRVGEARHGDDGGIARVGRGGWQRAISGCLGRALQCRSSPASLGPGGL